MTKRVLFRTTDIFSVCEYQKQQLRAKFERVSEQELGDNSLAIRLAEEFSINIPTLIEADKYATTQPTKVDVSRDPRRMIFDRSQPFYMAGTELTIHVPFHGDPALFDVKPTTFNLNPPVGDIENSEVLIVYNILDQGANVNAEVDRNLGQIRQHLDWLRPSADQLRRALEQLVQSLITQRKAQISERGQLLQSLGIPLRTPAGQQPQAAPTLVRAQTKPRQRKPDNRAEWDVFISHATEDKDSIARELAQALQANGLRVWFDEFALAVGDSLRESIDHGLAQSRFGVVILSEHFFAKHWPMQELNGLATREINGAKVILPVWHQIGFDDVRHYSPTLADRVAVKTEGGLGRVVEQLLQVIR